MRVTPLGKAQSRVAAADNSVLAYIKCVGKYDLNAVAITASTVTVPAGGGGLGDAITFTTNAAVDTDVDAGGIITLAVEGTIQGLLDRINDAGGAADVTNVRYRASVGDFRPGYVIGAGDAIVVAAQNILLGEDVNGYALMADSTSLAVANLQSVCLGGPFGARGQDPFLPDQFESDYTTTTAGVRTAVRSQRRRREEQNSSLLQTLITSIHSALTFNGGDNVINVYDIDDNLIWTYALNALTDVPVNVLSEDHPIVGPMGSPLFVEVAGTAGVLVAGVLSVRGYRGVA